MALSVEVRGAFQLSRVARALREAGRSDLDREMRKGLEESITPLKAAVVSAARQVLPDRYAAVLVPALRLHTQIYTRAGSARLRIRAEARGRTEQRDVASLDRGRLRHPVYGRYRVSHRLKAFLQNPWVDQRIQPGFFTRTMQQGAPIVRPHLEAHLNNVLQKITRG